MGSGEKPTAALAAHLGAKHDVMLHARIDIDLNFTSRYQTIEDLPGALKIERQNRKSGIHGAPPIWIDGEEK